MRIFLCLFLLSCNLCFAQFYSQSSQDKWLTKHFFKNKKEGVFVDIGAHDGVSYSNTYFFEKEKNWKGICIEPIPEIFEQLKKNRKAICIQGCISEKPGTSSFMRIKGYCEMLSGLPEKYDPKHAERIDTELKSHGGEKSLIEVQCYKLNDLLAQNNFSHVDYLSLDTEGGELEILKSIDFSRFNIDVITVENNYDDPEFKSFLSSKGYELVKKLGSDEVYKKKIK